MCPISCSPASRACSTPAFDGTPWCSPRRMAFPSGNAQFEEASFFNKSNFFDKTDEKAVAINLQPLAPPSASGTAWFLNLLVRGGAETDEATQRPTGLRRSSPSGPISTSAGRLPGFSTKSGGPVPERRVFRPLHRQPRRRHPGLESHRCFRDCGGQLANGHVVARAGTTLYSYAGESISDRVWAASTEKSEEIVGGNRSRLHASRQRPSSGGRRMKLPSSSPSATTLRFLSHGCRGAVKLPVGSSTTSTTTDARIPASPD